MSFAVQVSHFSHHGAKSYRVTPLDDVITQRRRHIAGKSHFHTGSIAESHIMPIRTILWHSDREGWGGWVTTFQTYLHNSILELTEEPIWFQVSLPILGGLQIIGNGLLITHKGWKTGSEGLW